jgi:molybdopterin synthase catalytic subunit/molybdopterin converting factor small subunit
VTCSLGALAEEADVQVEVRLFGGLRERVGSHRIEVAVPDDATVADLRAAVAAAHPSLADALPRTNVAVDLEVARDDVPIAASSELALLPPVAGGAGDHRLDAEATDERGHLDVDASRVVTGLVTPPFDVDAVAAQVTGPSVGGTAIFLGTVRDHAPDLDDVVALEYSAYDEMAERVLADLAQDLLRDHPAVSGIALLHAVGELPVGAHTVLIVCAAAHRAEAFDACRDALERVKDHVPVWKREIVADGAHRWVGLGAPPGASGSSDGGSGEGGAADRQEPTETQEART